jgi:hypothetical protein
MLRELRGRSAAIAVRTPTWTGTPASERRGWAELVLAPQGDVNLARYLRQEGTGDGETFARRLVDGGSATRFVRRNPRLLQVLQEAYRDELPPWLPDPAGRPGLPPLTRSDVMHGLWSDLLHRVDWPNRVSEDDARRSLSWSARQGLFASSRFAWWHVPGAAAQDPDLGPAYRRLQWSRAMSALGWALATFGIGLLGLTWLLWIGVVGGYDRASHGLQAAGALKWSDVRQLPWGLGLSGLLDTLVTNPVYLAVLIAALVGVVVVVLARLGGEFEHEDGGQPQTIKLVLPRWRDLGSLTPTLHRRAVLVLLGTVLLAVVLQSAGVRLAAQLWAGSLFAAMFVLVLAWLHWCADATDVFTPAGTFAGDRASTRAVALVLGTATLAVSVVLSWWFTSAGHVPTLQECLWIVAAAATSVGLARGFSLGAGMGAQLLLQVRPGFGIGYAARMRLLERAIAAEQARGARLDCAPAALIGLLDLEAAWRREPGPKRIEAGMLLRPVGPLIRLRESNFGDYLRESAPPVQAPARANRNGRLLPRSYGGVAALATVAAIGLLTCTGMAAVVIPRLPCLRLAGQGAPSLFSNRPSSTVWLENGQCVGIDVLNNSSGTRDAFTARGVNLFADPERQRTAILDQIARQNAAIGAGSTVTVLFLAPLTRTSGSNAINALWQLDGARAAQAAINAGHTLNVRLMVANSGENFTSGASVVQEVGRQFPHDPKNSWSIKAVIGVAQSRTSAREALAQLGTGVQIVAASVNGTDMRHGLVAGQDPDLGARFVSVSPDDAQVAAAMLDSGVLGRARAQLPDPKATAQLRVITDPDDTFFAQDLSNSLRQLAVSGLRDGTIDPALSAPGEPEPLEEVSPASRYRQLAEEMCAPGSAQAIWLFAGRGNQLAELDHTMSGLHLDGCQPTVVAGPGGISAVSVRDVSCAHLDHLRNLFFYTLVSQGSALDPVPSFSDTAAAVSISKASDRATGYTSLVEAVSRIPPVSSRICPEPADGVTQLGLDVPPGPDGDGHNTLAPSSAGCGDHAGTPIYFCPFAATGADTSCAAVPPAEPAVRAGRATSSAR